MSKPRVGRIAMMLLAAGCAAEDVPSRVDGGAHATAPDESPGSTRSRGVLGVGGTCDRAEGDDFANQTGSFGGVSYDGYAHTRYVSKTGSNGNSGTSPSSAWASIEYAIDNAPADTTIYVGDGTYDECVRFRRDDLSPSRPIRIKASNRHGAVIDPAPGTCGAGDIVIPGSGQKYIVIEGFRIDADNGGSANNRSGIFFYTTSSNVDNAANWVKWVVLKGNRIENAGDDGIKITLCENCYILDNEVIASGRTRSSEQAIDTLGFNNGVIADNVVRTAPNVAMVMKAGSRHSCMVRNTMTEDINQGMLLGGSSTNDWIPRYARDARYEGHRLLAMDNVAVTRGWSLSLMGCDTCEGFSNGRLERTTSAGDVYFAESNLAGNHDWDTRNSSVTKNCGPSIQVYSAGLGCGGGCNNRHANNGGTSICEEDDSGTGGGGPALEHGAVYEVEPASATGKRLDVQSWGTGNGSNAQLWSDSNNSNQRWKALSVSGDAWELAPMHAPGLRLDASSSGNVHLWSSHGGNNQRWKLLDAGGGWFELEPLHAAGKRLDASGSGNGATVHLWSSHGGANQRWRFLQQ